MPRNELWLGKKSVCSGNNKKIIKTPSSQKTDFLNVAAGVTCTYPTISSG